MKIYSLGLLRKVRRAHRSLRRAWPSMPAAVLGAGAGMVMPDGRVALLLQNGKVATYAVFRRGQRFCCHLVGYHEEVVDKALNKLADFAECIRAAKAKSSVNINQINA
jgi:hypothetical protein